MEKNGYWQYYHQNGKKSEQGHFTNNKKEKYWFFYGQNSLIIKAR